MSRQFRLINFCHQPDGTLPTPWVPFDRYRAAFVLLYMHRARMCRDIRRLVSRWIIPDGLTIPGENVGPLIESAREFTQDLFASLTL